MEHFYFRESDGVKLLVCEPLEKLGFVNAFSTRLGGVSALPRNALSLSSISPQERENVAENRRRLLAALGVPEWQIATARQFHSTQVVMVRDAREYLQTGPVACDALSANVSKVLLAVQTADCMPLLLADPRTQSFAAVHAGWRGTLGRIVARTVEQMQQDFGSRPEDLYAAFGPAISAEVFEVGIDVLEAFRREFPYAEDLISERQPNGKGNLDLNLANARQLQESGVATDRIYDCGLCTWLRNDLFFSYRRENGAENPVGRLMGVIGRD
jgi:hypothetical protein